MSVPMLVLVFLLLHALRSASADPVTSALCRTNCIQKFLGSEPKEDRECAIDPDCFLCWEHCGLLSKNNASRDSLCEDGKCSEGCVVACGFFRSKRQLPKERLIFPSEPVLNEDTLEWGPVPNASLYSVSLVYLNRTMFNIAQTVSCKLKIPKPHLMKVVRIVVIAVNKSGALGLTNFNLIRRIVKKNVSSSVSRIKETLDPTLLLGLPSASLTPALWITQGKTINLDGTLGKTNISWQFVDNKKSGSTNNFLVKWWTPDLNMEGRIVVKNGSQSVELTYLFKYFCFVKVKVLGLEVESQILVLKKDNKGFTTPEDVLSKNWFFFLCVNGLVLMCILMCVIALKAVECCRIYKLEEKMKECYEVYT